MMKKKKLVKELKGKGAKLLRQGGSHEFWESKNGYRFPIPRHAEIDENLAREILKQAEK
jgi:predicted RNA binding protein YcfA (HicA-like mRNA interferase family)